MVTFTQLQPRDVEAQFQGPDRRIDRRDFPLPIGRGKLQEVDHPVQRRFRSQMLIQRKCGSLCGNLSTSACRLNVKGSAFIGI